MISFLASSICFCTAAFLSRFSFDASLYSSFWFITLSANISLCSSAIGWYCSGISFIIAFISSMVIFSLPISMTTVPAFAPETPDGCGFPASGAPVSGFGEAQHPVNTAAANTAKITAKYLVLCILLLLSCCFIFGIKSRD